MKSVRAQESPTPPLGHRKAGLRGLLAIMAALALGQGCSNSKGPAPGTPASLDEINRALAVWAMQHGRVPTEVHQLTNLPGMQGRTLPPAPPGQKLVINPRTQRAEFVPE